MPERRSDPKYFAHYAEPEAALADSVSGQYGAALVVPVCRESIGFLDGYRAALKQASEQVLVIIVVNARERSSAAVHAANQRLLRDLAERFRERVAVHAPASNTQAWLARSEHAHVLWLDRASVGARLPAREGVGTARKVGADLAVALWRRGQVACAQIACSDADATLPADYFARLNHAGGTGEHASALLWPFRHEPGADGAELDAATVLYDISLRYYVLGLAAAGSPYAYQSVGSSLSFDAATYTRVRGFPKRAAAEDFYLLAKLAKVAPLRRLSGAPIGLRARASDRVPFGTGAGAQAIVDLGRGDQLFELYSPSVFAALGVLIEGLSVFAETAKSSALREFIEARAGILSVPILDALARLRLFDALVLAGNEAPAGPVLRRRVHTFFDALRTLRFIHLLRDRALPSLPWREALALSPFVKSPFHDGSEPEAVSRRLALAEAALPALVGPGLVEPAFSLG